jgi:polysaccharide export outer membrane protein
MKKSLSFLTLLIFIFLSVTDVSAKEAIVVDDNYRLGLGDVLSATIWTDDNGNNGVNGDIGVTGDNGINGDNGNNTDNGLIVKQLSFRIDGKMVLSLSIKQLIDYRLGPGDGVSVYVWGNSEFNAGGTIRPDGKLAFPLLGELTLDGLTPVELTRFLTESLKTYITDPHVTVNVTRSHRIPVLAEIPAIGMTVNELTQTIKDILSKYMPDPQVVLGFIRYKPIRIYVLGEVGSPGIYDFSPAEDHNLLDAIKTAGNYTRYAKISKIKILNEINGKNIKADLKKLIKKADLSQDYELNDGDVVYVAANGLKIIDDIMKYLSMLFQAKFVLTSTGVM